MKMVSMMLAALVCATVLVPTMVSPAGAYTHWRTRWHYNRFGHGCRTTRVDRYFGGRHVWHWRRVCR